MEKYLFEYVYGDAKYIIDIVADSEAEAKGRLRAAGRDGKYLGISGGTIPAGIPGAGLLVRAICAVRNFFAPSP